MPPELARELAALSKREIVNRMRCAAVRMRSTFTEKAEAMKWFRIAKLEAEMNDIQKEKAELLRPWGFEVRKTEATK